MDIRLRPILLLALALMLSQSAIAQKSASSIMDDAKVQAQKQDKHIFLLFHASGCGWCKRMDNKMSAPDTKDYFNDHFVITHLTVLEDKEHKDQENPGGMKVLSKFNGEHARLPFWVIMDNNGKRLTDSFDAEGNNLGCPATKSEVAALIEKLKVTTPISKKEQRAVSDAFVMKNN